MSEGVQLFVMGGSMRKDSLNGRLVRLAAGLAREAGVQVELVTLKDLAMPLYDEDLRQSGGLPPGARVLVRLLRATQGFIWSVPEYNLSIPGVVKNAVDWVSRERPVPFVGRHGLLLSASPSQMGGNRGLWATRVPLEALGAHVYPEMFSLARADEAFDAGDVRLLDEALQGRLEKLVWDFVAYVARASGPVPKRG